MVLKNKHFDYLGQIDIEEDSSSKRNTGTNDS